LNLFMENLNVFTSFPRHLLNKLPNEPSLEFVCNYAEIEENVGNWYLIKYK